MTKANQIADWANTAAGQRDLPRLVRRLAYLNGTTTSLAVPSGESTSQPGWDGELHSREGNAWVPAGYSCWEVSCQATVATKANGDFQKRTREYPSEYKQERSYVFVTARKWPGKSRWVETMRAKTDWKDVRAYDADDLEQWLEQSPAVALAFAEELGLTGHGVESLSTYLDKWLSQTDPALSASAVLTGRSEQSARSLEKIGTPTDDSNHVPISLKADSVEEATAFAAASLIQQEALADSAVVITDAEGWRFVETNTAIRIALAATPEIAEAPACRAGLVVIVPYASGDMARHFKGVAGKLDEAELHLERPTHQEFEEALQQLGVEENDAHRLSVLCGRSWSVFRRQHASNPSIRRPAWLDHAHSSALSVVCLLGGWSSGKDADKELVERISGMTYDELEKQLIELERLDDSPILRIGEVWKAKSALELLALFGDRLTDDELNRFFESCEALLSTPDPQLELPEEDRHTAAIYGKVRPVSSLLMDSLCDTLIKLAVRGPEIPAIAAKHVPSRVDLLVRRLLKDADATRWLSLSGSLRALAEASPDEFLAAVEASLSTADAPFTMLMKESKTSFMGRCWHAGLLWALEMLAWAPQRLTRVSLILAKLSETKLEGNWGNTPLNSLLDLYRSWFPQTGATIRQRIAALDVLIKRAPDATYKLVDRLISTGHDMASPTARPKWRDDDAGAGRGVTVGERREMLLAALDRQIDMARGNAERSAALLKKLSHVDDKTGRRILALLPDFDNADDIDKERLREALRDRIHWHRNYDNHEAAVIDAFLRPLEEAYRRLEPKDLIIRHAWLMSDGWPHPPVRTREEDYEGRQNLITALTTEALREVYDAQGWRGLEELAEHGKAGWRIGRHIDGLNLPLSELARWIVEDAGDLQLGSQLTSLTGGILCALSAGDREKLLDLVIGGESHSRDSEWQVRLLVLCPEEPAIWQRAEALGADFEERFWRACHANFWLRDNTEALVSAIRKLLAVRRAVSALNASHREFSKFGPELVAEILEGISSSDVADIQRLDAYSIQEAIKYLEKSEAIEGGRLARLEFALFSAFGYENEEQAQSLYHSIMSEPSLFVELLCLLFKPASGESRELNEAEQAAAKTAWRVLHSCKRQPGTDKDGSIDPEKFATFVSEVRRLAAEQDRLTVCDVKLGEIMAHAPNGEDGRWPFEPAREVLEMSPNDEMLRGFMTGTFNKRGMTSRGVFDGGGQERELAADFRQQASALEISHPRLANMLERIAKSYDHDGLLEDLEVKLRREGH